MFISLRSSKKPTVTCLRCRQKTNKSTYKKGGKYQSLVEHYEELKRNLPPCVMCGDDETDHKEHDHFDPKGLLDPENTKLCKVMECKTIQAMDEEAAKCRSLCRKCHCKVTAKQQKASTVDKIYSDDPKDITARKRVVRNRRYLRNCKLELGGCQADGCTDIFDKTNLSFYEWDHVDASTKKYNIAWMRDSCLKTVKAELDKCILLCSYCHYKRTKIQQVENKESVFKKVKTSKHDVSHIISTSRESSLYTDWRTTGAHGPRRKCHKLTDEEVAAVRHEWSTTGITKEELRIKYNSSTSTIQLIITNKTRYDPNYMTLRS